MRKHAPIPTALNLDSRFAVTVAEAAAACGVSEDTISREIRAGRLPCTHISSCRRIAVEALRVYLRQQTTWPSNPAWARQLDKEPSFLRVIHRSTNSTEEHTNGTNS